MSVETITISRVEYDRLRQASEDLEDLVAYDRAMANRAEGMPHAVLKRIVAGESPVAVIREWRGLIQAELARRAGVHRVQVHDIEAGRSKGSVETLKRIAAALDVPLDDLA